MSNRLAALAAGLMVLAVATGAAAQPFTLEDAHERVVQFHPDLRLFVPRREGLEADARAAALRPALEAQVDLENVLGSGPLQGTRSAELTLSLAGVLERGGKREARRALAAARIDALSVQRAAKQLDLLAEATRRYVDLAALQAQRPLLAEDLAQRRRIAHAARQRFAAGAAPEASALAAEAGIAQAEARLATLDAQQAAAWRRLSLLWGAPVEGPVPEVTPVPESPPALPTLAELTARIAESPELLAFADEARIREARLRLAETEASPDADWSVGVRRLQDGSDTGLVAGFSLPLGTRRRAEPAIAAARAEREALGMQRESAALQLEAVAVDAWSQVESGALQADRLRTEVLPRLERAAAQSERAYRAGALSYLEWAAVQTDITTSRFALLEARVATQRALIELQRLTAESWTASDAREGDTE
ncbi:TolC family protein [Silanimonas sp.]|uniref:TolC family protein n=1 Tax=Silanimonas sp. TaxID=1929290 RepID=UPI0022BB3F83|nr:TolC family protein [Silanimonas sp.]MCZ8167426.1 TolC family protein [Silanimonas sp.]